MNKLRCAESALAATALLLAVATPAWGLSENDYFKPLGQAPEAHKKRIKGGEAFPPLPLPATPLRRSERKREPAPPTLIGKVIWGESADFTEAGGTSIRISDWNLVPADCQQLLKKTGRYLNLQYKCETVNLATFSGKSDEIPVLFFSGGRRLKIPEEHLPLLREYVRSGGMLWFDCVAGSPFFYESTVALLKTLFPEESARHLPADHPLYHMMTDVDRVTLPAAAGDAPQLDAIYVSCRVGAVISKFGLGCGWDNFTPEKQIEHALYYDVHDASTLGMNMVAYAVGYQRLGQAHARPEPVSAPQVSEGRNEFVFAQVRHNGVWNTDPGGPANLLRTLATDTNLKVNFRRKTVSLGVDSLDETQFLYLSGCQEITLTDREVSALRAFLNLGGTVLVDNAQGLATFDQAIRRELKKVLPDGELKPVAAGHPVFASYHPIGQVTYTPAVQRTDPERTAPCLEGIALDGDLRVIYSRFDLGGGWQGDEHPQGRGYARNDALRLGVNLVVYAMTH